MMRVFVCVCLCVYVCDREIEIKWRDIVERLGALALRAAAAAAVCGKCSTLIQPPGGTVQSEHSSRAGAMAARLPPPLLHCIRGSQDMPTRDSVFFFWNDACVLKLCPLCRLSALQDLSSMYKGFKSLKDIYKDKCNLRVTIPFLE